MAPEQKQKEFWLPLVILMALCLPIGIAWRTSGLEFAWDTLMLLCG